MVMMTYRPLVDLILTTSIGTITINPAIPVAFRPVSNQITSALVVDSIDGNVPSILSVGADGTFYFKPLNSNFLIGRVITIRLGTASWPIN